jgi:hypothetical protein
VGGCGSWAEMVGLLPAEVRAEVREEAARHERLQRLHAFQRRLVSLRLCTTDGRTWTVELLQVRPSVS